MDVNQVTSKPGATRQMKKAHTAPSSLRPPSSGLARKRRNKAFLGLEMVVVVEGG